MLAKLALSLRVQAVVLLRIGQSAHRPVPLLGALVRYINQILTGADISLAATIGPGLVLYHPVGVVIGPGCHLGRRCTIMQGVTLGGGPNGRGGCPRLGDHVYVGPGAKLIGGIEIGSHAMIGANAVVLQDVPAYAFAAGVPAVIRRMGPNSGEQETLHATHPLRTTHPSHEAPPLTHDALDTSTRKRPKST